MKKFKVKKTTLLSILHIEKQELQEKIFGNDKFVVIDFNIPDHKRYNDLCLFFSGNKRLSEVTN